MYRNIEINYKLNEKKDVLTVNYKEELKAGYKSIIKEYDLIKYDESSLLYNQLLDDLDAEYDDILAELIDKTINKIMLENMEN